MELNEIISGLQFTVDMFLFNPSTGEFIDREQLNDLDKTTVDSCTAAIEVIKELRDKRIRLKRILNMIYGTELHYGEILEEITNDD